MSVALLSLLLLLCRNAFGAQAEPQPDFLAMTVRMFSVLALILGALVLAVYLAKKAGIKTRSFLRTKHMEIVDRLYVGPKQSLVLLKAGNEFLLLGISSSRISFLSGIGGLEREKVHGADCTNFNDGNDKSGTADLSPAHSQQTDSFLRGLQKHVMRRLDGVKRHEVLR